jgi:hypothetical protein
MLGHGLEQGGLHLGRRPVHLVGQQQVVEHRAGLELERAVLGAENLGAGDVARQQVGSELDAVKVAVHGVGQLFHRAGLGETGSAFHQQVAAAQ